MGTTSYDFVKGNLAHEEETLTTSSDGLRPDIESESIVCVIGRPDDGYTKNVVELGLPVALLPELKLL